MNRCVRGAGVGVAAALLFSSACAAPPPPLSGASAMDPGAVVDELLAADRAFSAASADTDLVSGLSAMFADDVVMPIPPGSFAEGAEEAIAALRANPANAGARATWVPVRGGVAADGRHGFTFGYMTIRRADGTDAPAKYLSYWIRRPEGWRVVA